MAKKTVPTHPAARAAADRKATSKAVAKTAKSAKSKPQSRPKGPATVHQFPAPAVDEGAEATATPQVDVAVPNDTILRDFAEFPVLADDLPGLVLEYNELVEAIKPLNVRLEEVKSAILMLMVVADARNVNCVGLRVKRIAGRNSYLSDRKLLEAGVTTDQLARGYTVTNYEYITVKEPKATGGKVRTDADDE